MRALIVGCGYVGLRLGAELRRQGHEVHGLRRTRISEAEMESAGIVSVTADITRAETLLGLPAHYDWVVLCAASCGGGPEEYRHLYLEGTANVIEWLAATPPQKLVYTSSSSVYGQNDGSMVDEASPTKPAVQTARILLETEKLLLETAREGKMPAVVLRLAGIYGPGRGYWLQQFLTGEAQLDGRGERILNMVHRDDVVGVIIKALQLAHPGEILNVVDNEPVNQLTCFEWLSKRLGRPLPPSTTTDIGMARKRGLTSKRVSNRRLRSELGYELKFPTFREGYEREIGRLEQSGQVFRRG